jgi:hypothetical protein
LSVFAAGLSVCGLRFPLGYSWLDFYDHVISLTKYSFSSRAIVGRFRATPAAIPRFMNLVRAVSSEGFGRIRYHQQIRKRLDSDPQFLHYFEQTPPSFPRSMLTRCEKTWGNCGVDCRKGLCITTPTPI